MLSTCFFKEAVVGKVTKTVFASLFGDSCGIKKKKKRRVLSFSQEPQGEVPVSNGSDKNAACGATVSQRRKPRFPIPKGWRGSNNVSNMGAVRAPSAGTGAIRGAHNGCAQVAQVVVCHEPCAAPEIDWKAFPKAVSLPGSLRGTCARGRKKRRGRPSQSKAGCATIWSCLYMHGCVINSNRTLKQRGESGVIFLFEGLLQQLISMETNKLRKLR